MRRILSNFRPTSPRSDPAKTTPATAPTLTAPSLTLPLRVILAVAILAGLVLGVGSPALAQGGTETSSAAGGPRFAAQTLSEAHIDQASRLYRATVNREADRLGAEYWGGLLAQGYGVERVAGFLLDSEEYQLRTSGDHIVDAYVGALGRQPDALGYDFWSQFQNPTAVVIAISDSAEHQIITDTEPPPTRKLRAHPRGFVNAGNGVFVPPILLEIRWCESRDDYTAANTRSTARGAYQFLTGSWAAYGHAERYGVSSADQATPAQQDQAALATWEESGTRPWNASRHCWG